VFEHIAPEARDRSFLETRRVLKPGGVLVGQIPNPYFPIESHSRLPFLGWLPLSAQRRYWRLSRVPSQHDFFVVTLRHVRDCAQRAGYEVEMERPFNYPIEAIPKRVRGMARAMTPVLRVYPWAWQFVLRRPR
jgi:SAM-dependent methyltransferase